MSAQAVSPENVENEMIEGLRARIEAWRASEGRSRAMPEELWEEASAAAQLMGVARVSRALGVGYEPLKRRAFPGESAPDTVTRTDFIELSGGAPGGASTGDEAVVEVVAADGAKLTVRVKAAGLNIAALINEFRGRA